MKIPLARQLLTTTLPPAQDERDTEALFRQLQFLSEYKYNHYEMYHPGRLFLENLYLWLQQFEESDRPDALEFVRSRLVFVSRTEFQQLAYVAYHDVIHHEHLASASRSSSIPPFRVAQLRAHPAFARAVRSSLYVGLSDGSRIDYLRRHNLAITNEQVIPHYATSDARAAECTRALRIELSDNTAAFDNLFLIEDFSGSGRTLLREVFRVEFAPNPSSPLPSLPAAWQGRINIDLRSGSIELTAPCQLSPPEVADLNTLAADTPFATAVPQLLQKVERSETTLKGALHKIATGPLSEQLAPDCQVVFTPLLITPYARDRLTPLIRRLPGPFSRMSIRPAALIPGAHTISRGDGSPIAAVCERYYDPTFADSHTGSVMYGFDSCGLTVVLHHNTPNNSIFPLWIRKKPWNPLFVRYERHGRESR